MQIRKATIADANDIAKYLLIAMQDIIYAFIQDNNNQKAIEFLLHFIQQQNNQYSYQNCTVVEINGKIVAAANVYDGADLISFREPISDFIRSNYNHRFNPENETQAGEMYIDTIGVDSSMQGQGIGKALLQYIINEFCIQKNFTLGLLVDNDNDKAKNLYIKLGFAFVEKKLFAGKYLHHLQWKNKM
jgi:ribosomal protein S18 acetylase RimI-like enzyme